MAVAAAPKVQDDLTSTESLYGHGLAARLAQDKYFETLTLIFISCNAIWIGVDLDWNDASMWLQAEPVFQIADNTFCLFFTFEICIRFLAFRNKLHVWKDRSFLFDSLLVAVMITETWILAIVTSFSRGEGASGLRQLSILRLLRLLRLTRMARLMRSMPELLVLAKGLFVAMRSVTTTFMFLIMLIWVFAIIFTLQYRDAEGDLHDLYFGRMGLSMVTLFVNGTLLDELTSVGYLLIEADWWMLGIFFVFMLLSSLTMLNMLIGILTDVVQTTAKEETQSLRIAEAERMLRAVFDVIDTDGDNHVAADEIQRLVSDENHPAMKALALLGVSHDQVVHLWQLSFCGFDGDVPSPEAGKSMLSIETSGCRASVFHKTDSGPAGLSFDTFMQEVLRMQPTDAVSVRELAGLRRMASEYSRIMETTLRKTCRELRKIAVRGLGDAHFASCGDGRQGEQQKRVSKLVQVPTEMILSELTRRLESSRGIDCTNRAVVPCASEDDASETL
eukprot:TRINITY_DN61039_c0_g1_i1.p1 TRINITY_DN61039_c0_g1~~TRINITY_DN61039_c0_g1_i1.p1  ORF type:complete len:542 (+),score=72.98 TRINITY_DN61039_c0_g1_i1:115-1626(+)